MKTKPTESKTEIQSKSPLSSELGGAPSDSLLARVVVLVSRKAYEEAANLLRTAPRSPWTSNTLGVCLMRCGRIEEALQIYRVLVLNPGTTVLRSDADDYARLNMATALTLKGTPSGALDLLVELRDKEFAPAARLRETITRWSNSLSFWRRLDWKFNRIDPHHCKVLFDYEPGEFPFLVQRCTAEFPSDPNSPRLAA